MNHECKVKLRKVIYESVIVCPFIDGVSMRELARRTGLDVAYLSRVTNGETAINNTNLAKLYKARQS